MWEGEERRKGERFCEGHIQLCEDVAVIKNTILTLNKRINGSIDKIAKHMDESISVRDMVSRHDESLKSIKGTKAASITTLITLVLSLITIAVIWGGFKKQVEINTYDIEILKKVSFNIKD